MISWEQINRFLRVCLCIFESDTVKSDCPVQNFRKKIKYLKIYADRWFTLLVLLGVGGGGSGDI